MAVAATASYARGDDRAYSDLELVVFLTELPPPDEDQYLQRIVDGLLIEAVYVTEESYLRQYTTLSRDWYIAGSATLVPIYNAPFIERIVQKIRIIQYPPALFVARAAKQFLDVQESFGKVLNALDQRNVEGLSLLLFDAVLHTLVTLSFLNQRPFTTFATFIVQARAFHVKPKRFDELLDIIVKGSYQDMEHLKDVMVTVFEDFEQIFSNQGWQLYDESIDPNQRNTCYS